MKKKKEGGGEAAHSLPFHKIKKGKKKEEGKGRREERR